MSRRVSGLVAVALLSTLTTGCFSIKIPELPRYAHYEVLSDPTGAHVFTQDGTYQGTTPTSVTISSPRPSAVEYSLRVVKRGFQEKIHRYVARCDELSKAAAKKNARTIMLILEPELDPADFDIPALSAEQRPTLAVIDFDVGADIPEDTGRAAADICREAMIAVSRYKLMDRNNIRNILGEQDFAAAVRCDTTQCLVDYGRLLQVEQMVHGRISQLGSEYILNLSLTDVNTAELVAQITTVIPEQFEKLREIVPHKTLELVARSVNDV